MANENPNGLRDTLDDFSVKTILNAVSDELGARAIHRSYGEWEQFLLKASRQIGELATEARRIQGRN